MADYKAPGIPGYYNPMIGVSDYYKHYDANPLTTRAVAYYSRYLLQKAMSVFKWTIPENWDKNFLLYSLYMYGFVCVTEIQPYGVIPQPCTIAGWNIYFNPARAAINNPNLGENFSRQVDLGVNGELLALSPDYGSIMDCIQEYAEMLANATAAVNTNLYNSRLAYVFYAKNKNQADSYKKMYDQIGTGQPAVFVDSKLGKLDEDGNPQDSFEPFNADLKRNYITSDVLEDMRRIEHMFAQKVGLPNTNTEKKERMSVDETDKSDIESVSNVVVWYDMIQTCIDRIKTMYPGITLSCEYRFPTYTQGGGENVDNLAQPLDNDQ